ncbi:hypothetical protein Goarm_022906 [Gossypium armourianum]|uniref:RNase H type-1 domain-containing protein n=1 Tax=Gossypium armourianum TaxID=34283 RepID=A0A7J9KFS0_9ROSI|nr:hypothetical protein [Gossypium armourianum]
MQKGQGEELVMTTRGFCGHGSEEVLHVLKDCLTARNIWDKLIPEGTPSRFIWKNYNLFTFQSISWSINEILKVSHSWARQCTSVSKASPHKIQRSLASPSIASSWVCLNTDGSVKNEEGFAAAGGLVCDHNGGWIIEFCRYLGSCTMTEVELWGILDGLKLILDKRFERVSIQTVNLEAVNAIQDGSSENSNSTLVRRIHLLLKMVKQWKIQHISRE